MRIDIRTAALDSEVERRIRISANLLAAYRLQAMVKAWDGTRCQLLVAAADDAYGQQAISLAARRGTPVIALGSSFPPAANGPITTIPLSSPAPSIARAMSEFLTATSMPEAPQGLVAPQHPGLCSLASATLRGRAVDIAANGRVAHLRPEVGRAYAASHSDLLAVADALLGNTATLTPIERPTAINGEVSGSLESLLTRAALRARDRLPAFPDGKYWLDAWPDLGMLPESVGALTLSRKLLRGSSSLEQLCSGEDAGLDRAGIHACLWAFAAADLLRGGENAWAAIPEAAPEQATARTGLWRSLARRFGLSTKAA